MKLILISILFVETTVFGQLHSSYAAEGIMKSGGGPMVATTQIVLIPDSTFTIIYKAYARHRKSGPLFLVDSLTSKGKWNVEGNVLKLDKNPEALNVENKFFDTYLIRKRSLKRTTLKDSGVVTIFKATGGLL